VSGDARVVRESEPQRMVGAVLVSIGNLVKRNPKAQKPKYKSQVPNQITKPKPEGTW
jgi:hypothetical protein